MFNITSTNRNKKRNVSTRPPPPTPPPPTSIPHTPSMSRIVMEGLGMGAGSAMGRSIVDRGFQSSPSPSQNTAIHPLSSVLGGKDSPPLPTGWGDSPPLQTGWGDSPPLPYDCECHIESYRLCIRNESGQCDYNHCKKMYDDYVSCVMAHPIT